MTDQPLEPPDIDASFVPRFRDAVVAVPVQNEAVLYEQDTGSMHQLDPIATLVCELFDGESTIQDIVEQLVAAFEADREVITNDVVHLARQLDRKGLFAGEHGAEQQSEGGDSGS